MKKVFYLLFILAAIRANAQDYPHSIWFAPEVDNIIPQNEIFGSANPLSRQIMCQGGGTSLQKYKGLLSSCNLSTLGMGLTYFPGAYARVTSNKYYILDQIGLRLLRMDTLGNETLLGPILGSTLPNVTGMTWDSTTGTMYVVTTDMTLSQIGRLDTATRIITPIGGFSMACGGAISISCSRAGTLFVIDIISDALYRVNKTTGAFTVVGLLGQNPNFGQDAQFDHDGTLYWAAYTTGPQLRILDTTTGSSSLICTYVTVQAQAITTIPALTTVGGIQTPEVPNHYLLSQNYPNPFNPTTKIKFGIPKSANVKLTVYDVLGRQVRVLVNQFKSANTYEIDFDGTNLPSGVYFYKLVADDFTSTKKMLMLK